MSCDERRLRNAIERFDAANAADPHRTVHEGQEMAAELLHAWRMTDWLVKLYPDASEVLRLAARSQHLRRWEIPRDTYPIDRAGYHHWRAVLYAFHADEAEKILREAGYEDAVISRVRSLVKKERMKTDPESQALEDVACLVFLENDLADFASKHEEEKVVGILRRTWAKMSVKGREAAAALQMPARAKSLIDKAIGK